MTAVRTSIEIAASPQEVWDVILAPGRLAEWVTIHRSVRKVSHAPLKEGSTMEQRLCLRGVPFNVAWEVKEMRAPSLVVMEGRGPARSKAFIRDELTPVDGGTRFDYVNDFKTPMGPLGAAAGRLLVGGVSEREATASVRKLKSLLERGD